MRRTSPRMSTTSPAAPLSSIASLENEHRRCRFSGQLRFASEWRDSAHDQVGRHLTRQGVDAVVLGRYLVCGEQGHETGRHNLHFRRGAPVPKCPQDLVWKLTACASTGSKN